MANIKWHLTEKREEKVKKLLEHQHSLTSIALLLEIRPETLSRKLKEALIDPKAYKDLGIRKMRSMVHSKVYEIEDPAKLVKAGLDYLSKYDEEADVVQEDNITLRII